MTNLINRFIAPLSALSVLAMSGAALAQTAPAPSTTVPPAATAPAGTTSPAGVTDLSSPEDCLKAAFDIAQTAEDRKLADDQLSKIEDLLTKMESHCDAKQFTEAANVGSDLKALIQKQ